MRRIFSEDFQKVVENSTIFVDRAKRAGDPLVPSGRWRRLRANLHRPLPGLVYFLVRVPIPLLNSIRAGCLAVLFSWYTNQEACAQIFLMADGAQWETCTGTFYDSGGSAGNYAGSENMTATLCPTGGPGSGPFTSITFTGWGIGLTDLLDNLVIHNGASASDPVLAIGSGLVPLLGQTFTSTNPSGCLTFVWTSDLLLNGSGWAAEIRTGPDAGADGTRIVCSNADDFDLFSELSGTPDAGGQWTFGGNLVSNTFTPATSPGGEYTYTVPAVSPCVDAVATVSVTKQTAADAGFDQTITVCSSEPSFSLRSRLLGSPQPGGVWTLAGNVVPDLFVPDTDAGGTYRYILTGTAPCVNDTSFLTIGLVQEPNAGTGGVLSVCSVAPPQDLFTSLGGSPGQGGTWTRPGDLPHSGQFVPGVDPQGTYTYTVAGQSPCANASSTVNVSVQVAADPGMSTDTTLCSNGPSINLKNTLGTTASGTWTGPSTVASNVYNPVTMGPGTYSFSIAATGACPLLTASVEVSETQAPDAGGNGTLTVCSSGANVDLFTRLTGSPQVGGSWTAPGGVPFPSGIFIPGTSAGGSYTYTLTGSAPCAADVATVAVTQIAAPFAGTNGSLTLCSTSPTTDMFTALGPGITTGGTWYKPVPPGGTVANSFYNPASPGLPAGVYTYVTPTTAPCPRDTASVTVIENQQPNAGTNGSLTLCSTGAPVNLITALSGAPGGGGSWLTPTNQPFPTGQFNPASGTAGSYKYIVTGVVPCITDTGYVSVAVNQQPNAGFSGDTVVCSDGANVQLNIVLNGSPGSGGQWNPGNGTYDPGTGQAGSFTYTISATAPCVNATAVATVNEVQRPNAGGNGTVTVCSTAPPFNLFGSLTGTPQPGGTWNPGAPGGVFTPGTSTQGTYTYTLSGTSPCANSSATVTVIQNTAPFAGVDGNFTICAGTGTLNLFTALGGTPSLSGTWTSLDNIAPGTMTNGLFTYTGVGAGAYDFQYAVNPSGGCPGDVANVRVTITAALDAGTNGNCNVCRTNNAYNLFSCLNGTPQAGGTWKRLPAGTVVPQTFNATAEAPGTYQFRYVLTGSIGCQSDSAVVGITVIAAPEAGPTTASVSYCSDGNVASLITELPGAQGGGVWRKQGQPGMGSGNYDPPGTGTFDSPGLFYYIVSGTAPCGADTARLTVGEVTAPDPGAGANLTKCLLSPAFDMTEELNGTPAPNGTWTTPMGVAHSSTFVPGVDPPGNWTYTVPGTTPCGNRSATLSITINQQPNAGQSGTENVCSNALPFLLSTILNGTFDAGGTWYDSLGTVVSSQLFTPGPTNIGENVFTYVLGGISPCVNDTETVYIFVSKEADAGISTSVEHCPSNGALDLFSVLGGDPDATGIWSNNFNGTYVPGIDLPGTYTYTVSGVPPCPGAFATVEVEDAEPPVAGLNTSVLKCTSQPSFGLSASLDGDPDSGGDWYQNGSSAQPFFDPGANTPGTYQYLYVVLGDGTCLDDSATLTITLFEEVDAGGPLAGNAEFCSDGPDAPLFPFLTGTPQPGGTWRRPNGQSHTGIFDPGVDPAGSYKYRKNANGACPADSATVNVTITQRPNAGDPGQVFVCSNQGPFPLINELNGTPQPGGDWYDPGGDAHSGIYLAPFDDPGIYTYKFDAVGACPGDSAQVNVIEYQVPDAGEDNLIQLCGDLAGTFPLITLLGGDPDPIGIWYTSAFLPFPSGVYNPGSTADGEYFYVVQGNAPCVNDTASVTIFELTPPDAGLSTAVQVCNTAGGLLLNDLLGGDPDAGGTWRDPDGEPHGSSTFNPASDPQGIYTYFVAGSDPCANDSATVTISLVSAPNAGTDATVSACINDSSVDLFAALGGSPQPTGTWTGANQVNGVFNATQVVPGPYTFTYTVSGGGSCPVDQSQVTVNVTSVLDAGTPGTGIVCSGTTADLFGFLGGSPQPGGIWRDLDITLAVDEDGEFDAGAVGVGMYDFGYVLESSDNCPGDSTTITVTVIAGPDAGDPNPLSGVCSDENVFDLLSKLGGSPDDDGQWYDPDMNLVVSMFDPATGVGGVYTYVVAGSGGCANDSSTVNIVLTIAPEAGIGGPLSVCSDGDPIDLFQSLTGDPQTGGTWTCCLNVNHSGTYIPAVNNGGPYIYTVIGTGACSNATATIFVTEVSAPNAGGPDVLDVCSNIAPFNMLPELAGSPQNTGTWTGPDGTPHGNVFNPAVDSSGVYTYTVQGGAGCDAASATLTINLTYSPNAGEDSTLAVCNTETSVDLFAALGTAADTGGVWVDITGTGAAFVDGILDASLLNLGIYEFSYSVAGIGSCLGDVDTITVDIGSGLDPGIGGTDTICGGNSAYNMFGSLGGQPTPGGLWTSGSVPGILTGSFLNATLLPPGGPYPFSYTVTQPGCGEASSAVSLFISPWADPGGDTTVSVCRTSNAFSLFNLLTGAPDQGGTWTTGNGNPANSTFDPETGIAGTYVYNLVGAAPCNDTAASVTIVVNDPPDAGPDGNLLECNSGTLNLNTTLQPGAQTGGTWADNGNTGQLVGPLLNLVNLDQGLYLFTYIRVVPSCGVDQATYTLTVAEPVRVSDTLLVCNEEDRTYSVQVTIEGGDPTTYSVTGLDGTISPVAPYTFTSTPLLTSQSFSIVVNDTNDCGPKTVEGTTPCVFDDPVFVPESFTPNGDNINDLLIIPGIEGYPGNTIDIFNRWGAEVYSAAGYNNATVVWDGTCETALLAGDLPTATYYYVLDLGNSVEPLRGFIYLNR